VTLGGGRTRLPSLPHIVRGRGTKNSFGVVLMGLLQLTTEEAGTKKIGSLPEDSQDQSGRKERIGKSSTKGTMTGAANNNIQLAKNRRRCIKDSGY